MSYSTMAIWWHIVHEAVAESDRRCDGEVPWRSEYVDVFPDPESLRRALAYYWQLQVAGQVDERREVRPGDEYLLGGSELFHELTPSDLTAKHRGLIMVVTGRRAATADEAPEAARHAMARPTAAPAVVSP
jgi:hypothetical protein